MVNKKKGNKVGQQKPSIAVFKLLKSAMYFGGATALSFILDNVSVFYQMFPENVKPIMIVFVGSLVPAIKKAIEPYDKNKDKKKKK